MSEPIVSKIELQAIPDFLRWVHYETSEAELAIIESEVLQRQKLAPTPRPREYTAHGQRLAGVYFTCLPGSLAMLGAMRTLGGFEHLGSQLLTESVAELRDVLSIAQIQAAVDEKDLTGQRMLERSNFCYMSSVDQMWLDIGSSTQILPPYPLSSFSLDSEHEKADSRSGVHWTNATLLTEQQFTELLEATFHGSLDCPELSGLRPMNDVLSSFLMGQEFAEVSNWLVVWLEDDPVGCLLLADHPNLVSEIAYMGLVSVARHRGLGMELVRHATERAKRLGHSGLVLAVDVRNEPAIRTYARCGFRFHRRLKVYLAQNVGRER